MLLPQHKGQCHLQNGISSASSFISSLLIRFGMNSVLGNAEGISVLPRQQPWRSGVSARLPGCVSWPGLGEPPFHIPRVYPVCPHREGLAGLPGSRGGSGGVPAVVGGCLHSPHSSPGTGARVAPCQCVSLTLSPDSRGSRHWISDFPTLEF